jgi:predicted lipoprotein
MANSYSLRYKKVAILIATLALAIAFFNGVPLFHVVSLKEMQQLQEAAKFDAGTFVRKFWSSKLLPATDGAVDLTTLLAALAKDPATAAKLYGRSPGLGGGTLFFVKGLGHVKAIEEDDIRVAVDGVATGSEVTLSTGMLFGNTVRDATGLLDVSTYANSEDFNDISSELNHAVETEVTPTLRRDAVVGKAIRFAGCVELDEDAKPDNLQIVPVKVEWP